MRRGLTAATGATIARCHNLDVADRLWGCNLRLNSSTPLQDLPHHREARCGDVVAGKLYCWPSTTVVVAVGIVKLEE
jgi:hypothetical protein